MCVCVYVCVMKTTPETWRHRIGPWSSWEGTVELCPPNSCGWSKLKKYLKFGDLTGSQHTLKKVANTEHWDACFFVQGQKDFGQCTNDNNPLPSSGISTRKLPFGISNPLAVQLMLPDHLRRSTHGNNCGWCTCIRTGWIGNGIGTQQFCFMYKWYNIKETSYIYIYIYLSLSVFPTPPISEIETIHNEQLDLYKINCWGCIHA